MQTVKGAAMRCLIFTFGLVVLCAAGLSARTWTDPKGRTFEGFLLSVDADVAQIRKSDDGKIYALHISQLGPKDQKLIRRYQAEAETAKRARVKVVAILDGGSRCSVVELRLEKTGWKVEKGINGEEIRKRDPYGKEWVEYPWKKEVFIEDLTHVGVNDSIMLLLWPGPTHDYRNVYNAPRRLNGWRPWPE